MTATRRSGASVFAVADPGRPANVHIRVNGWPNQRFALLFVDWLKANPDVREDYLAAKRRALETPDYAEAKEPWFLDAYWRAGRGPTGGELAPWSWGFDSVR